MKKYYIPMLFILAACAGGSDGGSSSSAPNTGKPGVSSPVGTGGSTNNGGATNNNNGSGNSETTQQETKQHYINTQEYMDVLRQSTPIYDNFQVINQSWPEHGGYKTYSWDINSATNTATTKIKYIYHEKELTLGNYGLHTSTYKSDWKENATGTYSTYIHNREGTGKNLYTPTNGIVFNGGTLAYLYQNDADPTLIKGDAKFTYNPTTPKLELTYDNYYKIDFTKKADGKYTVDVSGTNQTGNTQYNLPTGTFTGNRVKVESAYVSKNGAEEAFGTYSETFRDYNYGKTGAIENDFDIVGSFGGTK